jgi:hypothetical protein
MGIAAPSRATKVAAADSSMATPSPGVWWLLCALALPGCTRSMFISKATPAQAENACTVVRSEVKKATSVYSPVNNTERLDRFDSFRRGSKLDEL